jgi:hypothetical protein
MKKCKIQNRSPRISDACVPLSSRARNAVIQKTRTNLSLAVGIKHEVNNQEGELTSSLSI